MANRQKSKNGLLYPSPMVTKPQKFEEHNVGLVHPETAYTEPPICSLPPPTLYKKEMFLMVPPTSVAIVSGYCLCMRRIAGSRRYSRSVSENVRPI